MYKQKEMDNVDILWALYNFFESVASFWREKRYLWKRARARHILFVTLHALKYLCALESVCGPKIFLDVKTFPRCEEVDEVAS